MADRISPPPRLGRHDQAVWDQFARQVTPLPGRMTPPPAPISPASTSPTGTSPPPVAMIAAAPQPAASPRSPIPSLGVDVRPAGLDAGSWRRLVEGRVRSQARLDLHGLTADQACARLIGFLQQAQAGGLRCVEVVTGLGQGAGGVIRHELPFWLGRPDCAPLLLAACHSSPRNHGAVRLLLRRGGR